MLAECRLRCAEMRKWHEQLVINLERNMYAMKLNDLISAETDDRRCENCHDLITGEDDFERWRFHFCSEQCFEDWEQAMQEDARLAELALCETCDGLGFVGGLDEYQPQHTCPRCRGCGAADLTGMAWLAEIA